MRHFEQQLQDLLKRIVLMGSMAETMIQGAVRSLIERNESLSREVFEKERQVDRLQLEIDEAAVELVALNQPMAADVRFLFAASRITSEIERIGDQAINVCQNARYVLQFPPLRPMVDISIMSDIVQRMVRDVLTAMVQRDVALAEKVIESEDQVDAFKDQIFRTLLTYMMADPGTIQRALSLILLSRNLERIGDHATNIAEEVIYLVQGRDIRHPSLSGDGKTANVENNGTTRIGRTEP